jgi:predicted ATPase/class 3 adenylate cyclase/DNA-binding CsgD family transcriptional regulator
MEAADVWDRDDMAALPSGTVTLLLGDVEGSTRLWETRPDEMAAALAEHNARIDRLVAEHDGVRPVEQGEGDSFVAAFARCSDAVACALDLTRATTDGLVRVRLGIHTGEVRLRDEGNYMGPAINRTARVRDAGHGGQILLSQTAADIAVDDLPAGATLVDRGHQALKGLDRPERIWQLVHPDLPEDARPLRTPTAGRTNLPRQLTSFIGRQAELATLDQLLDEARAVTLTGAGGCGKTRLAVELAADRLDAHPGGVWFVDLATTNAPDGVEAAVASAMGALLLAGPPLDTLARAMGNEATLVVFDNCEHLVEACARVADELLRRCPILTVLATSREPLGFVGEVTFRIPSLGLPEDDRPVDARALEDYEAVALFVERARRARPGFALDETTGPMVVDICRRLDGIPLAIELAAARMRALSPAQVRDGLEDRFRLLSGGARTAVPRQQTLQASVEWSYGLLLDAERTLLNRLAVFAGGFDVAATEQVCAGDGLEAHHVFDLLLQLVDKSLVMAVEATSPDGGDRFTLLETVRSYGASQLLNSGEAAAVQRRHYDWCLAIAKAYDGEDAYRARVTTDYENVRRALQWAEGQDDPVLLARLAARVYLFWATGRQMVEGAQWFDLVAARETDPGRRAMAVSRLALLLGLANDYDRSMEEGHRAVEMTRALGEPRLLAFTLLSLSQSFPSAKEQAEAAAEALELAREAGDSMSEAWALFQLGWQEQEHEPVRALELAEQALAVARQHGHGWIERMTEAMVATLKLRFDPVPQALEAIEGATEALRQAGEGTLLGTMGAWLALTREVAGDHDGAERALEELDRFDDNVGVAGSSFRRQTSHVGVLMFRGQFDEARERMRPVLGLRVEPGMQATAMGMLAYCEAMCGEPARAVALAADAARLSETGRQLAQSTLGTPTYVRAVAARANGDLDAAEQLAFTALDEVMVCPMPAWVHVGPLQVIGSLWVATGRVDDGVRLLAAAAAEAERKRFDVANGLTRCAVDGQDEAARAALGDERFDDLWQEGAAMSWDDAVAFARRGRGERKRPKVGWDALTPTERQVVDLVAEGATNNEIAERLFMAEPTVKTHLTHVYAKLGLTSRTQLAAAAARQPDDA